MSSPRDPQGSGKGPAALSAGPWQHRGKYSVLRGEKKNKERKKFPIPNSYLPFSADRKSLMGEMGEMWEFELRERDRQRAWERGKQCQKSVSAGSRKGQVET